MTENPVPTTLEVCGIRCDFRGQHVTSEEYTSLLRTAEDRNVLGSFRRMMDGEVVNLSEKRAALHTLLRSSNSPLPQYSSVLVERNRMLDFADKVRNGAWRGFSGKRILNVINIGIGGSETGVRAVYHALVKGITIRLHFLSAADGIRLDRVLGQCDPRSTLVVVSSKTFTTRETLANARSVDAWFAKHGIVGERRHHHIVCVSANENAADLMGVPQFSIGNRLAVVSRFGEQSVCLWPLSSDVRSSRTFFVVQRKWICIPAMRRYLAVMLALMSYRASENPKISSRCVLPYDERLREFIPWLQQLEMESLGKPADRDMSSRTGLSVWGACGNDGQHSFYQWLREGVACTAIDLITCAECGHTHAELARSLNANAVAQSQALLHREPPFYNLLTAFELSEISAKTLGALMALHEHKTTMLGTLYGINPFDQPGVELGKKISIKVEEALAKDAMMGQ